VPALVNPSAIAYSGFHGCAIEEFKLNCWGGAGLYGQYDVPALVNPSAIAYSGFHGCAIEEFKLNCWGHEPTLSAEMPTLNFDGDSDGFYSFVNDVFPQDSSEWQDTDLDGIGNNLDTDDDSDSVLDIVDAFPLDKLEWLDTDEDGIGNNADKDDDNDGILDVDDSIPLFGSDYLAIRLSALPDNVQIQSSFLDKNNNQQLDDGEETIVEGSTIIWKGADTSEICAANSSIVVSWTSPTISNSQTITLIPFFGSLTEGDAVEYFLDFNALLGDSFVSLIGSQSNCDALVLANDNAAPVLSLIEELLLQSESQANQRDDWFAYYFGQATKELATMADLVIEGITKGSIETSGQRLLLPDNEQTTIAYIHPLTRNVDDGFPSASWWKSIYFERNNLAIDGSLYTKYTNIAVPMDGSGSEWVHYQRDTVSHYNDVSKISFNREFQGSTGHQSGYLPDSAMACGANESLELRMSEKSTIFINLLDKPIAESIEDCAIDKFIDPNRRIIYIGGTRFDFTLTDALFSDAKAFVGFSSMPNNYEITSLVDYLDSLPANFCESGLAGADSVIRSINFTKDTQTISWSRGDDWSYSEKIVSADDSTLSNEHPADQNINFNQCDFSLYDSDRDGLSDALDAFKTDPAEQYDTDRDGIGNNTDLDDDGDSVADSIDNCPLDANTDQIDSNADGIGDACPSVNGIVYDWNSKKTLGSVQVLLSDSNGTAEHAVVTDNNGYFTFDGYTINHNSYLLEGSLLGKESNSAVTSADALAALKIAVGLNPNPDPDAEGPLDAPNVSAFQKMAADANGDGKVTSADALQILKMAVGLYDSAGKPQWRFVGEQRLFDYLLSNQLGIDELDNDLLESISEGDSFNFPRKNLVNLVGVLVGDVNGSFQSSTGEPLSDSHLLQLSTDTDGDFAYDVIDPDDDNDGIPDVSDAYPKENIQEQPFFDPNDIIIDVPEDLYADVENVGTLFQRIVPVDINLDGLMDFFLHQSGFSPFDFGPGPAKDSLVAYIQQADGSYVMSNELVFGQYRVEFENISRKHVVADFNGDGYKDVGLALNREDGRQDGYTTNPETDRNYETTRFWASPLKVLMSNGDGTYRIDTLPSEPRWQHEIATAKMPDGKYDLIYKSVGQNPATVFRVVENQWVEVTDYPYLNGWDMRSSIPQSHLGLDYSQHLFTSDTFFQSDGSSLTGAKLFSSDNGQWSFSSDKTFGEFSRIVNFTFNGESSSQPAYKYLGVERMSFGMSESCALQLNENESIFIFMLDSQNISEDMTEPYDLNQMRGTQLYVPLKVVYGQLVEMDILSEQDEFEQDVYFSCEDINNDGLGDLVIFNDFVLDEVKTYLNNGSDDLVLTTFQDLDTVEDPNYNRGMILDVTGDGLGDLIQFQEPRIVINKAIRPQALQ